MMMIRRIGTALSIAAGMAAAIRLRSEPTRPPQNGGWSPLSGPDYR